ncbi:MAG: O-antigen ligase family protein, partial [Bacteroidota bacterium]|nr:O-antigen ligase family protein [Bacteroidota bacterium]
SILLRNPYWLVIPFGTLLFPLLYHFIVLRPDRLFWLLLITFPLSTEWMVTHSLGLDFPDEALLILLTAILLIRWIHEPRWLPKAVLRNPLGLLLVLYFGWLLICTCYAVEPLLATKYLLAKTWYVLPLILLPQVLLTDRYRFQKLALCLLLPMALVVIQVLIRYAFFGFAFEKVQQTMWPFFRNHVNYSSMLVCLLPVGWCCWKLTPKAHPMRKWILYGLLLGLTGLFFAYSRGAWIALLAGLATVGLMRFRWIKASILLALSAILISTAWLAADENFMRFAPDHDHTIFHTDFREHLLSTVEMTDVSTAERFYRWIAGVRMLAEKPITGFGPNSFYLHYRPYTVARFQTWVSDNPEHSTVHNYFILLALEQGLPGLILFCLLFFGMLMQLQNLYHQFQSRFYRNITLVTAVVLVMIGVINSMSDMIETDKIGGLFWLCMGIVFLLGTKAKEEQEAFC